MSLSLDQSRSASSSSVRVGVVEIGSRSIRLLVADLCLQTGLRPVMTRSSEARLIEAVRQGPDAVAMAMADIQARIREFRITAAELQVDRLRVIGTRALREILANGDLALVAGIDILSENDEAIFSLIASLRGLPDVDANFREVMLVDQGGGSLEIVRGATGPNPRLLESISLPLGSNGVITKMKALNRHVGAFRRDCDRTLDAMTLPRFPNDGRLILQGSIATRCAWLAIRRTAREPYEPWRIQGRVLTAAALFQMMRVFESVPSSGWGQLRASVSPNAPQSDELEAVIGGIVLFLKLMASWNVSEFTVSGYGTRYGVAWALAGLT